jgi:hypothetical protein
VDVLAVLLLRDGIVRFNRRFELDDWVELSSMSWRLVSGDGMEVVIDRIEGI